ncbi:hypothetical protein FFF34_010230 [Inquilinus sp. KBS0705]|nr:hypothetical protein FFF34_010230 [Inquilinus sp. KBS0705]
MSHAADDLRLELAHFNNFIIQNYLAALKATVKNEPLLYLYNVFKKMGDSLCTIGNAIAAQKDVSYRDLMPLNQTVFDAALSIFLIERSNNLEDLILRINGVNTYYLQSNLENIDKYGLQFGKDKAVIEDEISILKQDNSGYFNQNGLLKYIPYLPDNQEILTYLKNNAQIRTTGRAFNGLTTSFDVFTEPTANENSNTNKLKLLTVLNIALISMSYIEPFLGQSKQVTVTFEELTAKIVTAKKNWQNSTV